MDDRVWEAVLFDNDQTLVRSTWTIKLVWLRFALKYRIRFQPKLLRACWGMTTAEVAKVLLATRKRPLTDAQVGAAIAYAEKLERTTTLLLRPIHGAGAAMRSIPKSRLAVVSSGSTAVIYNRLSHCSLPIPDVVVSSEDIERGKPDPQCYQVAASRLGVDPRRCLVVEDSPHGLAAAKAAGCATIALLTSHWESELEADWIIEDLRKVRFEAGDDGIRIRLSQ